MPFEKSHFAFELALVRELAGGRSIEHEEQTVCTLAAASLRHAYPGAVVTVGPTPGRPGGELGLGSLDVRLTWQFSAEPPLVVRVIVHDELVRGLWREASTAIGEAVREALASRCPPHPHPDREKHHP